MKKIWYRKECVLYSGRKKKALYIFKITKNVMINVNTAFRSKCQATVVTYNFKPVKAAAGMEERLTERKAIPN